MLTEVNEYVIMSVLENILVDRSNASMIVNAEASGEDGDVTVIVDQVAVHADVLAAPLEVGKTIKSIGLRCSGG